LKTGGPQLGFLESGFIDRHKRKQPHSAYVRTAQRWLGKGRVLCRAW
jgi:hypothetical protein